MELPRDGDDYIKETIDHSLGLPISMDALQKKLYAAQESQLRLNEENLSLVSRLKQKDQLIDLIRSQASINNALALKKLVEDNQKLRGECDDLKKKCFVYRLDLAASKKSRNEAEERAREEESRVQELEQEVRHMSYVTKKQECLVDSVLASIVSEDEAKLGRLFLEVNIHNQSYQALLSRWEQVKPSMKKAVTLASMVMKMDEEKEFLVLKLDRMEHEVELVREQNRELNKENRQLSRSQLCSAERSSKSKKRKEKEA